LASSVDKAASLSRLAADFSAGSGKDAERRCVTMSIMTKASGASATTLATGWKIADGPRRTCGRRPARSGCLCSSPGSPRPRGRA